MTAQDWHAQLDGTGEREKGPFCNRDWCAVAKLGRRCGDDMCRTGETLCGFTEEDFDDICGPDPLWSEDESE